jgi:hypothetical protein
VDRDENVAGGLRRSEGIFDDRTISPGADGVFLDIEKRFGRILEDTRSTAVEMWLME